MTSALCWPTTTTRRVPRVTSAPADHASSPAARRTVLLVMECDARRGRPGSANSSSMSIASIHDADGARETPLASDRRSVALADRRKHQNQYGNLPESGRVAVSLKGDRARKVRLGNLVGFGRRVTQISPSIHWVVGTAPGSRIVHPCECRSPHRASLSNRKAGSEAKTGPAAWTECRFGLDQRTFTAARPQRASRERSYSPSVFSRCIFLGRRRRSVRHTGNPPIIGWKAHSNGVLRRSYLFRC